ncbi:MAG: CapA family protein [Verrucomicrobia bacterium]|nr:CapA family protein [Verrucomicrobiota bacterium]
MSDNHAETFGWIARTFDLDRPVTLVLVDAHSDASTAGRSDDLREGLRRVGSAEERARRVEKWRSGGRIQAFNWIEPLMPRPLERVVWVADVGLDANKRAEMAWDAAQASDGRLGKEPRGAGSFASRWEVLDLAGLKAWKPGAAPVVLSIDLDFLAGRDDAEERLGEIWETAMDWPGLAGVAFAISRPWLGSGAEADRLVRWAVGAVARTRGAELEWDLSVDDRPDSSLKADAIRKEGGSIPRWDVASADPWCGAVLEMRKSGWRVSDRKRGGDGVAAGSGLAGAITVDGARPECDGVVRLSETAGAVLRVRPGESAGASGWVKWFARVPVRQAYDLLPETGLGKSFSKTPGRWVHERRIALGETSDFALAPEAWAKMLDPEWHCGRVVIEAEYESRGHWLPTDVLDVRVRTGEGFHGALSECFGMPYVFGIALQEDGGGRGVDSGWGSDCSNFLAHAWRKSGTRAPWGDPGMLRRDLTTIAERATPASGVGLDAAAIRRGVMIDFGNHVAALWEDRDPVGTLDGGDLLAHHLGGVPEVVALGELARGRGGFAVRTAAATAACRLGFAGDGVLAGDVAGMDGLTAALRGCDLGLANLEGIPSPREPERPAIYDFRFPAERLAALRSTGVRVVSLANNHAADAGAEGLTEGRRVLETEGLGVVGAGRDAGEALRPWLGEVKGCRIAVFGVCAVDAPAAGAGKPGVLRLPDHADALERRLAEVLADGRIPVVMIHWGDESIREPNADQRRWARWLTERGVAVVAGSGPHVVQAEEFHAGGVIAHSLGNAIYPKSLLGRGDGMIWRVSLDKRGSVADRDAVPALAVESAEAVCEPAGK